MKQIKIIWGLMVVMFLFVYKIVPIKALNNQKMQPLVVLSGNVDKECLQVDGYFITSSNVDFEEPGKYEVTYKDYENKDWQRTVIVIDNNTKEIFNHNVEEINTFLEYPMELEWVESFNENKHLLIVKYLTDPAKNKGHIYMYMIEDYQITKEVQLKYNVDMQVNDVLINGNIFIITGTIYNTLTANYDIVFYACRSDGFLLESKVFGGSEKDEAFKIIMNDNEYVLLGLTSSTDNIFQNNKKENSYFSILINQKDYQISKTQVFANDIDFRQTSFISDNEKMYLIYQLDNSIKLINISLDGSILKTKTIKFTEDISLKYVYFQDEEIRVVLESDTKLIIGNISFDKGFEEQYLKDIQGKIITANNSYGLLSILYEEAKYHSLLVIDDKFQDIYYNNTINFLDSTSKIRLLHNQIIEGLENEEKIKIHIMDYIKINTLDVEQKQVVINGKTLNYIIESSIDSTNFNYYGKYDIAYYFEGDYDFLINSTFQVPLECSIVDGGIYDIGTVLEMNAEGYLNDERITNYHIIEEPGHYELELVGAQDDCTTISFEIRDLSIKTNIEPELQLELNFNIDILDAKIDDLDMKIITSDIDRKIENNEWEWVYAIPLSLGLLLTFIIIKKHY